MNIEAENAQLWSNANGIAAQLNAADLEDVAGQLRMDHTEALAAISAFEAKVMKLASIRATVQSHIDAVANAEAVLTHAESEFNSYIGGSARELMRDLEVEAVTFADGMELAVEQRIHASITEANEQEAFQWFMAEDEGEIIGAKFIVTWKPGRAKVAEAFATFLCASFPQYLFEVSAPDAPVPIQEAAKAWLAEITEPPKLVVERGIHPGTLKAWAKKMLKSGREIPKCISVFAPQVVGLRRADKGKQDSKPAF